jgi:LysR family glycine cleavage system transcriptional activator
MDNHFLDLPPLDALRGFAAVARRMSITQAADDLCLTQSAVSRQIQSLEAHFGTPLFLRRHRAITLTDAGKRLATIVTPWLEQLAQYNRMVRRQDRLRSVTITASIGVTSLYILPRLGAFHDAHPDIDVRVSANNRILDMRREGIDLAFRYARQSDVPPGSVKLFDEKVLPVASPAVAQRAFRNPRALLEEMLLEYDEHAVPWLRWSDWLSAAGLANAKPRAYLQCNQYDQLVQAALDGRGVALGRVALVLPMLRDGRLVALPASELGRSDYAYWLVDAGPGARPEVQAFRDWIIGEVTATAQAMAALTDAAAEKPVRRGKKLVES